MLQIESYVKKPSLADIQSKMQHSKHSFFLPYYHIKHMPQILLILALQNTDMLRLLQFEFTEAQQWMKEVRHAIVQCYVKEPLLYHFTMSDVKKESAVSIKLKCYDELSWVGFFLWPPTPLCFNCEQYKSQGFKKRMVSRDIMGKNGPLS